MSEQQVDAQAVIDDYRRQLAEAHHQIAVLRALLAQQAEVEPGTSSE